MDEQRAQENFAYFEAQCPEPKIELVDGRLLVGNGLAGSRLLFDHLVRGWGVAAATAFGTIAQWIDAFCAAYHLMPPAQAPDAALTILAQHASRLAYVPRDVTAGDAGTDAGHRCVRMRLAAALFEVSKALGGRALARDFVMRLGPHGFTPDVVFFTGHTLNTLYEYYLDGPAELVIEVTRPAHRDYDHQTKRTQYARAGVPEYLIVDPATQTADFLRLVQGEYVRQTPDADGLYRPRSVPGLAIAPHHLWPAEARVASPGPSNSFLVETSQPMAHRLRGRDNGLGWGGLPCTPRLDLPPVPLRFEEYICWCPEAKFEFWDGRIQLSGEEGVRNLVGMLLMTLGLVEGCQYAPPSAWVAALQQRRYLETHSQEIRRAWRQQAMQAASAIRTTYHPTRMALVGEVLSPTPLTYWSRLRLAMWDVPPQDLLQIYNELAPMHIELIEGDRPFFQKRLSTGGVVLEDI
jgi:Uma2 family endonuclease